MWIDRKIDDDDTDITSSNILTIISSFAKQTLASTALKGQRSNMTASLMTDQGQNLVRPRHRAYKR